MRVTAEPRSDQWNADDFIGSARVFTVASVKIGSAEQKYDIELVEGGGRFWRPPLTVLRLLIAAWGDEASKWHGRRVKLFRDESVRFGPDAVGGIRVEAMSDLPFGRPFTVSLTTSRGKRSKVTVQPLHDEPTATGPTAEDVAGITSIAELRELWKSAKPTVQKVIEQRVKELETRDPMEES